jgi:hypothetical protein
MSYRVLQLSPLTSTEGTHLRIAIQGHWNDTLDLSNATFLRSWVVYDSRVEDDESAFRLNWNVALGMLLVTGISAGFWTGVGLLVAQGWK